MTSPFVVLPSSPEPPRNTRVARGTNTALIDHRTFRLHQPGEKPWTESPDNHRDQVNVEVHGDTYVVYKPSVGALSALSQRDYIAFHVFMGASGDVEALTRYYTQIGQSERVAKAHAQGLSTRLISDGWTRTELPNPPQKPLMSAYFTVTRWCDLGCPYCYQGLNNRVNTDMSLENARLALQRIQAVNPDCQINVTGGEPFSHKRILEILDLIDEMEFDFVILSNGTYVDEKVANHLKGLKGFKYIQISLDGASAETHELTRGKGHFPKAMRGIQSVIDAKLPFKIAPTLHEANLHELTTLAELALNNGGWLSPNQLKELPHAGLNYTHVSLSNESLRQALRQVNDHLVAKYGLARFIEIARKYSGNDPEVCSVTQPNSKFICGMAHSLIDIDWNGDVYPCHLSKGPELIIGNVFAEDFEAIFRRVEERGIRVKSHEIEKCSGCKFVSNCAGGCRAGAWFTYGTFEHEDELCDINYASNLNRLLVGAGVS